MKPKYKTIFVSDIHLGSVWSQADLFLNFLEHNKSERIYLIGDIIDEWALKKKYYWPSINDKVIENLMERKSEVFFIPGNHDEIYRNYFNKYLHGKTYRSFFVSDELKKKSIKIIEKDIYKSISGHKFLIVHGDQFDPFMKSDKKIIGHFGDVLYDSTLWINHFNNILRKLFNMEYWSISAFAKDKVKNIIKVIGNYEKSLSIECQTNKCDGVICGHIHHAKIVNNGIFYINCGDWVESCTAIVENFDGTFEIIKWDKIILKSS